MIQLKVYEGPDKLEQFFIDLYETEPIKLTLSIEDITSTDATSTYSKAFKVPGTRRNAEFFKNAFDVDGTLYDVTIKKPAEILVDGTEFKEGNVRLQRVLFNTELDRYDYEMLFLGETRDFSSIIGEAGLCDLDLPELVGDALGANIDVTAVKASWQAYPENASLTAGLHNGNIIYPLIDHGNTYTSAGTPIEAEIALANAAHSKPFTNSSHSLNIDRMKPMIRARRIVDAIFLRAGYTFTSTFFDSNLFHQIYISAFGNEATVSYTAGGSSTSSVNTAYGDNLVSNQSITTASFPNPSDGLSFPNNQVDVGNNLANRTYTVPTATGDYTFVAECFYDGYIESSDYNQTPVQARLTLYNYTRNLVLHQSIAGVNQTLQFTHIQSIQAGFFQQGDQIGLVVIPNGPVDFDTVTNVRFAVTSAPGQYNPSSGLECSYKQIDFIKDLLTAFRLVLAPDPKDPRNFIIEPWQTYINSGDLYDWSKKLVENKDVVIEPVFFSQSDVIKFDMQTGGDYTSVYHKQAFSETYGYLEFDSGNELLKGKRDVKLNGIASTPIVAIEGSDFTGNGDIVILPQLHTHSNQGGTQTNEPIKVKTRMLFYNGIQPFTHPSQNRWYLTGDGAQTTYPLVSPYQEWPIQPQTLNLNWFNDVQYWGTITGYNNNGSTLYSDYWSRYISSLYNKYSRRVTAYFVLNNIDLNAFSFDDTIFVNGTYYRPEKIIDVEVGAYTEVKVQLLTANDYRPKIVIDETLTGLSGVGVPAVCNAAAKITITTDGTPGFTWSLSNGITGTALQSAPSGQAPYTFDINALVAGTYTVTITDSLGRTGEINVTIGTGTVSNVVAPFVVTNATNCTGANDGIVDITPSGGQAPYTVYWQDGSNANPRTGMVPGVTIPYYVVDANGCISPTYSPVIGCTNTGLVWYFAKNFNCTSLSDKFLKVEVTNAPNPTDIVTLNQISNGIDLPGCYSPIYQTQGIPDYTISQYWVDCETCQGIVTPTSNYRLTPCDGVGNDIVIDFGVVSPVIGSAHTPVGFIPKCYEVVGETIEPATNVLDQSYNDCPACESAQSVCIKMNFANDGGLGNVSYQYTNCDGNSQQGFLTLGQSFTDCVRTSPTPQIGPGGTITEIEPCD